MGVYIDKIPSLVAVACFLPSRAKDLSAPLLIGSARSHHSERMYNSLRRGTQEKVNKGLPPLIVHPCHELSEYSFCKVIFAFCGAVTEPHVGKTACLRSEFDLLIRGLKQPRDYCASCAKVKLA